MSRKREQLIAAAEGGLAADSVIRNVSIFHLTTGETELADISIRGGRIAAIGSGLSGKRVIDGSGLTAVPGFLEFHVHVESSLLTPYEYEKCVLPHGVTTVFCDPHELANVAGTKAFDYFLECAENMILDLRLRLSSCVPSTDLETAGAKLAAADLAPYRRRPHVSGLAEFMNVPGVLSRDPDAMKKLDLFDGADGHAPLLSGRSLCAYIAAGITNDHECSSLPEALEKIRRGMTVIIREGSVAENLDSLIPLITIANAPFLGFCTDDRNPLDIAEHGHIDSMIARSIAKGADPLAVYRTASYSPARSAGLTDRGLIAPGKRADIVLLSDLKTCRVHSVLKDGLLVTPELFGRRPPEPSAEAFLHSVRRAKVSESDFTVHSETRSTPVIGVKRGTLITDHLDCELPLRDGIKSASPADDILKLAVLERHGINGNIGLGFVKGFGMRRGAVASSVGHDSHNLCVTGVSDSDMACAVNALIDSQGGFAVAVDGRTTVLPLPVGGLMSDRSAAEVERLLRDVRAAAAETGCLLPEPFLALAFLPLPVIPFLRLTDRGVVDAAKFQFLKV